MKRSKFNLSHYKLLTCDPGLLIPIGWYETLPGDSIQQRTKMLIRVSPMNAPAMHPHIVRIHNFFLPYRKLWDNFESFITGGEDGLDATVHPYIEASAITEGSLGDYMGLPVGSYSPDLKFNALPFRAYNMIYNHFYRDQDLIPEVDVDTGDGADTTTVLDIQKIAWEKDYFTTARGATQLGAAVSIPIGTEAPITGIGKLTQTFAGAVNAYETDGAGTTPYTNASFIDGTSGNHAYYVEQDPNNAGYPNIRADLAAASGVDVNDLRLAFALQRYQEARQQYGARYVEYLRYLGVKSSDARLNNPQFLSGGRNTLQFSEVLATDGANTGDLYGHGIGALRTNRFRRFFEEHGLVMSLLSIRPKSMYTQGLHKKWSREVNEDYFQKELQFIGEDEVYNKEVYADHTTPDGIFGYQARYDEYRSHPSTISGEFLSTLDHYHEGRIFSSDPALNQSFVECTPPKRIISSSGTDMFYIMASHSIVARRMMAKRAYNKIL